MNDKILRDGLEVLLLHTSPKEILREWSKNKLYSEPKYLEIPDQAARQLSRRYPDRYSLDDSKRVFDALNSKYKNQHYPGAGVFALIIEFAKQALTEKENRPFVKYDQILRWRSTVHPLGTTPFICAYLADQDHKSGVEYTRSERHMFSFNPVLSTDNRRLESILNKGMAENHFHLKGSTPSFLLSWVCLMNDISNRCNEFELIDKNPLTESLDTSSGPMYVLVWQAAAIRAFLFECINNNYRLSTTHYNNLRRYLSCETSIECEAGAFELQAFIESLRAVNRLTIEEDREFAPDFAICHLADHKRDKTFDIFSGENWFQYKMFEGIINKRQDLISLIDLFYAYLLIFIRFRSELVQCNKQFGFKNFNEYDDRKSDFIRRNIKFVDSQKRIAALTNINDKRIVSFEARIVPEANPNALDKQIKGIDKLITLARPDYKGNTCYVLHVPKKVDMIDNTKPESLITCRNMGTRVTSSESVNALKSLRDGCELSATRIRGIDACANEIGCRPEVFAPVFRSIKKHQPYILNSRLVPSPMINITFHVGEDFLDIVDGLRAIWEAIEFLELGRNDRLGHALALGINADKWYDSKQKRVFLARQDLLDNCAWMLYLLGKLGDLPSQLAHELQQVCATQYAYIYQNNIPAQEYDAGFSLKAYINAMRLRGDEPSYYMFYHDKPSFMKTLVDAQVICPQSLRDDEDGSDLYQTRRHDMQAIRLYHHYHYNPQVKQAGSEILEYQVIDLYTKGVANIQKIIQKLIAERGIGIETNPSSNVLIGNFNRYDCHPLVVFNDMHLFDRKDNPLLFASINTDDQGVFDTCLENEYALIARGLEQMTNDEGEPAVSSAKIYLWLDNIRQMGIEQSFVSELNHKIPY